MVIVVPTFSNSKNADPPDVSRIFSCSVSAITEAGEMAESVNELSAPKDRECSDQTAESTLPTEYQPQKPTESEADSQIEFGMICAVIVAKDSVELILHQVMRLLLQLFVGLHTVGVEHPFVECVRDTLARGMRIKRSV